MCAKVWEDSAASDGWYYMLEGCTRVADEESNNSGSMTSLELSTSICEAQRVLSHWTSNVEKRGALLDELATGPHAEMLHGRFVSAFWGFTDDTLVQLECQSSSIVKVQAQSQLRIGKSDMDVNYYRVKRLWEYLEEYPWEPAECYCNSTA
ncbi:hypothetical protein CYMTET_23737 [Cymbomonas tetramitiformis]|uniref:Uncharacterized protein n=1 Tax=Cymbomonas tetramitiformis TaxID=36881 RepID=A0AAE0L0Z3_9CHLO|nr:hypothetical protein CYMTET_23737 [Cymbomonas tetramitiformis]